MCFIVELYNVWLILSLHTASVFNNRCCNGGIAMSAKTTANDEVQVTHPIESNIHRSPKVMAD